MGAVPSSKKAQRADADELLALVKGFVEGCARPAAIEPGTAPLELEPGCYNVGLNRGGVLIEAWNAERTLARRLVGIVGKSGAGLELVAEHFGGKTGAFRLVDLGNARSQPAVLKAGREVLLERLGEWLSRQFAGWRVKTLTTGADLEHTLSPSFPRAVVEKGRRRWVAVASPGEASRADQALTFGLIWLDYVRLAEPASPVEGLALFLPRGTAANTLLRLSALEPGAAAWRVFEYDAEGGETEIDPSDCGNLVEELEPWRSSLYGEESEAARWCRQLECLEGVEAVEVGLGERSLRVRGVEFARLKPDGLWVGIDSKRRPREVGEAERMAAELAAIRTPDEDSTHPYRTRQPERWLESVVREDPRLLNAHLRREPVYGQVAATAGADRGLIDLLAIDTEGRLTAIELKASEDPHLPMQALDYWIRVRWHAARGEFARKGYFPGLVVLPEPPKLMLVAPAFRFHSTVERLLGFYSSQIDVVRIGLGVEWQRNAKIVFLSRERPRQTARGRG